MEIVFIIFLVLIFLYLVFYYKLSMRNKFVFKIATSMLFLLFGIICYLENFASGFDFRLKIIIGLSFGFVGDIILGLRHSNNSKKDQLLIFGIFSFLIGHIVYIWAISYNYSGYTISNIYYVYVLALAIILTVIVILLLKSFKLDFSRVKKYIYIYISISSLLLSFALINYIYISSKMNLVLAAAALSFILSDFLLAFIYFKKSSILIKIMSIFTYYTAQILFAYSISLF